MTAETCSSAGDGTARAAGGPGFFHAVALDYDGTLAESSRPDAEALTALGEARASGQHIIIVTGRILADLRAVFPDLDDHADMVIAENGAVLARGRAQRNLSAPVPDQLAAALVKRGVALRRGQVLLACDGAAEPVVLREIRRLGLECQLVRNRGALMVLPAGVSKATGLAFGLADLGISCHNTIAVGDAENDHSLLAAAEVGVAVSNAVPALKAEADIVLAEADGRGIASLLHGPVLTGRQRVHPRRWQVELGALADGASVSIPASQVNVLVTGVTQGGKSYLAGLIAERLIRLGYSLVVVDPEGDHAGLGQLPGMLVAGSGRRLPSAGELADLVRHHPGGVVLDLSAMPPPGQAGYLLAMHQELAALHAETGLPHWVIIDEAHGPLPRDMPSFFEPAVTGYCLVTYRPEELPAEALRAVDFVIALPGDHDGRTVDLLTAVGGMSRASANALLRQAGPGHAVLVDRGHRGAGLVFEIGHRETGHMRHWHKYSAGQIQPYRQFYFRRDWDTATGATAASLGELEQELRICEDEVIMHHCHQGDFSRWVQDVLGDPPLAKAIADIESCARSGTASTAEARTSLVSAIHQRYLG